MKINITLLLFLMLLSTTVTMAQKPLSVKNTKTPSVTSLKTTKNSSIGESSYEIEFYQVSEGLFDNNDKTSEHKLQENKIQSEKARTERAKITEAIRKRLKKSNPMKTNNSELLEARKRRAVFIQKNRVLENSKDRTIKESKQN